MSALSITAAHRPSSKLACSARKAISVCRRLRRSMVADDLTDGRGQPCRVSDRLGRDLEELGVVRLDRRYPPTSSTPSQIMRALRTSSNITYWARVLHRRRLLRSSTSLMTATESITTITLATRPASMVCRPQKLPLVASETTPPTNAARATMARSRVRRRSELADRERRGPELWPDVTTAETVSADGPRVAPGRSFDHLAGFYGAEGRVSLQSRMRLRASKYHPPSSLTKRSR